MERIYLVHQDETFLLDRQEGTFEYAKRRTPEHFFYHLYQDKAAVAELLAFFEREVRWEEQGEGLYQLTVSFSDQTQNVLQGVPVGWEAFVRQAKDFMAQQNDGILF